MKQIKLIITILRMSIGWHFLYEGMIKIFADNWSAESYLNNTYGPFSSVYQWLAASPLRMEIVDFFNIVGLTLIGLGLFVGLCTRYASLFGTLLLLLFYFAYPPFGISLLTGDGTAYIINPLLIEAIALIFLFFYKEKGYSLDNICSLLVKNKLARRNTLSTELENIRSFSNTRREAIKELVSLPVLGALGWGAFESNKKYSLDGMSGATIQLRQTALNELKGELPKGKLGGHEISRLVMGGNLIGGWAHARDLIYANSLFKAYNTEKKIFETLLLCEEVGINTINIGYPTIPMMTKYKKITGGKMKVITQVGIDEKNKDIFDNVTKAIDSGMDIIQLQGNWTDKLVQEKHVEIVGQMIERIRSEGYVAGLGAHAIDALIVCEENGIIPDYYMKTMHHDNYWSAHPRENRKPFEVIGRYSKDHNEYHDNCFCPYPDRTIEFINRATVPVMGFKVLAAGSITPEDGFRWAFENGADFICVGMFDFQIVSDVNICIDILNSLQSRKRDWYA